jgi:hypothetical protein
LNVTQQHELGTTEVELGERDRAIIEFERQWW